MKQRVWSIRKRFIIIMFLVELILIAMFFGTIFGSNIFSVLQENSFNTFKNQILECSENLENHMSVKWGNIKGASELIGNDIDQYLYAIDLPFDRLKGNPEAIEGILTSIFADILMLSRNNNVTGAFFVMDASVERPFANPSDARSRAGIYIRDTDLEVNNHDFSDLQLEIGSYNMAQEKSIVLENHWRTEFRFDFSADEKERYGISTDYFDIPYREARWDFFEKPGELAYWCPPFRLEKEDEQIITCSIPVVGKEGLYGILGIELSLEFLKEFLKRQDLSIQKDLTYILSFYDNDTNVITESIGSGSSVNRLTAEELEKLARDSILYKKYNPQTIGLREFSADDGHFITLSKHLSVYGKATRYPNQDLVITGVWPSQSFHGFSNRLFKQILFALFFSLCFGAVVIFAFAGLFVKPITNLARKVLTINPDKPVAIERTHIQEVNELSEAIEHLSFDVAKSSSRVSKIIELMDYPIAAFEIDYLKDRVFVTDSLKNMFVMLPPSYEKNFMERGAFLGFLHQLKEKPEKDYEDTYRYSGPDGHSAPRWYRVNTVTEGEKELGVIVNVTKEILDYQHLAYERDFDPLTKLLNRQAFYRKVKYLLFEKKDQICAMALWDLDNLKNVNDTYGHDIGDLYIKEVAHTLTRLRVGNAVIGRMAGDEFLIFLYDVESHEQAKKTIERAHEKLNSKVLTVYEGIDIRIKATAGFSCYPDDSEDADMLVKYADFAMYEAKNTGRGMVRKFDRETYKRDVSLFEKETVFNQLLEKELVDYKLQPIIDARSGEVFGYEAFMRPKVPQIESASEVLKLARLQSKMYEMEKLTYHQAFELIRRKKEELGGRYIFIHSIANQRLSPDDLKNFEQSYPELFESAVFEISQSERCSIADIREKMGVFRKWGSKIAISDFGAGHVSKLTLLSVDPDFVKIDMSLVRNIHMDGNKAAVVKSLISYAESMGIGTVAQGIETKEELQALLSFGVDYIQGYFVGMPDYEAKGILRQAKEELCRFWDR